MSKIRLDRGSGGQGVILLLGIGAPINGTVELADGASQCTVD